MKLDIHIICSGNNLSSFLTHYVRTFVDESPRISVYSYLDGKDFLRSEYGNKGNNHLFIIDDRIKKINYLVLIKDIKRHLPAEKYQISLLLSAHKNPLEAEPRNISLHHKPIDLTRFKASLIYQLESLRK